MAGINYFLKPLSWKVLTDGGALLGKILPAQGSTIKIERQVAGSSKVRMVALNGAKSSRVLLKELTFHKGRGRLELKKPDYVLVIEEAELNGKPGLRAKAEPKQALKAPGSIRAVKAPGSIRKLPQEDMTGTWGAEANPGGGKQGDFA